jgi:hypothetical protein
MADSRQCFECGSVGHIKTNCPRLRGDIRDVNGISIFDANSSSSRKRGIFVFVNYAIFEIDFLISLTC